MKTKKKFKLKKNVVLKLKQTNTSNWGIIFTDSHKVIIDPNGSGDCIKPHL